MKRAFFLVFFLLLSACRSEAPSTYILPKQIHTPVNGQLQELGISFSSPKHWLQGPSSGMRLATYIVPSSQLSERGLVTVVLLPQGASELAPNLNRWRRQLGLKPSLNPNAEVKAHLHLSSYECLVFDLSSLDLKKRFLIGMIFYKDQVLFVKLEGSYDLLGSEQDHFFEFLKGTSFE